MNVSEEMLQKKELENIKKTAIFVRMELFGWYKSKEKKRLSDI
jgi:hypothetical protein